MHLVPEAAHDRRVPDCPEPFSSLLERLCSALERDRENYRRALALLAGMKSSPPGKPAGPPRMGPVELAEYRAARGGRVTKSNVATLWLPASAGIVFAPSPRLSFPEDLARS